MKMKMFSFLLIYKDQKNLYKCCQNRKSLKLITFGGQKALSMYDLFETPIIKVLRTHSTFLNNLF